MKATIGAAACDKSQAVSFRALSGPHMSSLFPGMDILPKPYFAEDYNHAASKTRVHQLRSGRDLGAGMPAGGGQFSRRALFSVPCSGPGQNVVSVLSLISWQKSILLSVDWTASLALRVTVGKPFFSGCLKCRQIAKMATRSVDMSLATT